MAPCVAHSSCAEFSLLVAQLSFCPSRPSDVQSRSNRSVSVICSERRELCRLKRQVPFPSKCVFDCSESFRRVSFAGRTKFNAIGDDVRRVSRIFTYFCEKKQLWEIPGVSRVTVLGTSRTLRKVNEHHFPTKCSDYSISL
jgi:hypothetical protein